VVGIFDLFLAEADISDEFRAALALKIRRLVGANRRRLKNEVKVSLCHDLITNRELRESIE
jgi:hypothetical protein